MFSLQAELPGKEDCNVQQARCFTAEHQGFELVRDIVRPGRSSSLWTSGHRLESTVRYLGIEVDDALEISEQTEI
jgi:hypothetical protein